ncbi:MAG: putative type restriction endonuclease, partial [Euryarchaeota archaeon]|nr:putative type restriction endonuclease [Euryarchaeota archaeon]
MDNLNEVLPKIIEKIKNFRSLYEKSEMAVRGQIVDPILRNIGWDTANPAEVKMFTEEGIPDYSLIKDGKTILFIEVKEMNVD